MVGLTDVKQKKYIGYALGKLYYLNYHLELQFLKLKFRNECAWGIVGPIDVE